MLPYSDIYIYQETSTRQSSLVVCFTVAEKEIFQERPGRNH